MQCTAGTLADISVAHSSVRRGKLCHSFSTAPSLPVHSLRWQSRQLRLPDRCPAVSVRMRKDVCCAQLRSAPCAADSAWGPSLARMPRGVQPCHARQRGQRMESDWEPDVEFEGRQQAPATDELPSTSQRGPLESDVRSF